MGPVLRARRAPLLRLSGVAAMLIAMATLSIGFVASTGSQGQTSWQHIAAVRSTGEARLLVDLWVRGEEAVYLERREGDVVRDQRCIAGTLTSWWPTGRVVRELADRRQCFELATDPLLGFVRAAQGPAFAPAEGPEGASDTTSVFEARDPGSDLRTVAVDSIRQVPLRVEFRNGAVSTWEYLAATDGGPPPPPTEPARTETYTDLTPEAAAPELGLTVVPTRLAGRPLLALFRYDSGDPGSSGIGPPRVTSTYAIWDEPNDLDGAGQIQLVITDHPPPPDALGIEDNHDGVVRLRLEEDGRQFLLMAPDRATLELAIRVLRPGLKLPDSGG